MFSMTYSTPSEIKGVIRVAKPIRSLGPVTDVEGERWNVNAIIGDVVIAVREAELHPYYTDTSGRGFGGLIQQTWEPYRTEVVTPATYNQ